MRNRDKPAKPIFDKSGKTYNITDGRRDGLTKLEYAAIEFTKAGILNQPKYEELGYPVETDSELSCRAIEVRHLRESHDLGDKILIERTKGSKDTYITVSDRLRLAIDKAKSLRPKQKITAIGEDRHIFCNANGERIKQEGLKSAMSRLKKKVGQGFWSLHLLKSKGLSDAKDKDMAGLTEQMKKRYDKQIGLHDAVE